MGIQQITVDGGVPRQGTAVVTISPVDENGIAVTFAQLTDLQWQLMRTDGEVVNSRDFVASAMTSLQFVLTGDDLAIFGDWDRGERVVSFQATYVGTLDDGSTFTGRIVAEGSFNVYNVLGQA